MKRTLWVVTAPYRLPGDVKNVTGMAIAEQVNVAAMERGFSDDREAVKEELQRSLPRGSYSLYGLRIKKRVETIDDAAERLADLLEKRGWTQTAAAEKFGVNLRNFAKWLKEEAKLSGPAEKLLDLYENHPEL